ncbi:MAG: VOC family protein [Gemmatimonadetes bacterium]|nr:VOC family protein [Gemmatimonadota bacterium]MBT8403548.1 VOC family protein [Gemmatimonadota bacterium]NNK63445.1 VOC family protein [Gemmatimonadota bacterium]
MSERFYCAVLGFQVRSRYRPFDGRADPCYLVLQRDGARVHLSSFRDDSVAGAAVYILVDSVDDLFRELRDRDLEAAMPPTDQSWGNREMYVEDPDGNSLRFVEEHL